MGAPAHLFGRIPGSTPFPQGHKLHFRRYFPFLAKCIWVTFPRPRKPACGKERRMSVRMSRPDDGRDRCGRTDRGPESRKAQGVRRASVDLRVGIGIGSGCVVAPELPGGAARPSDESATSRMEHESSAAWHVIFLEPERSVAGFRAPWAESRVQTLLFLPTDALTGTLASAATVPALEPSGSCGSCKIRSSSGHLPILHFRRMTAGNSMPRGRQAERTYLLFSSS